MNTFIDEFLADRQIYCRDKSIEYYSENLERFERFLKEENVELLSDSAYRNYILHLREKDISNVTIATYSRAVKVFYKWLHQTGYIDNDITLNVKLPRPDNQIIEPLFKDDVLKIDYYFDFTNLKFRNKLIFHLMLDCGLRSGEVVNLTDENFDLEHRFIKIQNTKSRYPRVVPLPQNVFEIYNWALRFNELDFSSITPGAVKMLFQRIKNRSEVSRVHAHLCRHTFATSFIAQGGNLEFLRLYMGHRDYETTRQYIHLAQMYQFKKDMLYPLDPVFFRHFS